MTQRKTAGNATAQALRRAAMRYPEAELGIACKGTALESTTVRARNKAFLFVGAAGARLKLLESRAEASRLASKEPGRYQIGAGGWAMIKFTDDEPPPLELLERWIDESYRAVADRRLVALLAERGAPAPAKKVAKSKNASH